MACHTLTSAKQLSLCMEAYFDHIGGEYHLQERPVKEAGGLIFKEEKVWDREPEPATIAGLALYLGFNSREAFEAYEQEGRFAHTLKRGRLRIEASYEKKLHAQSPAGAIFALKSMGWNDRPESKTPGEAAFKNLKIEIVQTGPKLAANEKEVELQ